MAIRLSTVEALGSIVDLRLAGRASDSGAIARMVRVEGRLRVAVGPSVPKTRAARALGVSVPTLDRWVDLGVVPVVSRAGSSRLGIETGPLVELLVEIARLRDAGDSGRLLSKATARLGWKATGSRKVIRREIAVLPRPNMTDRALRTHVEATTHADRLRDVISLSGTLTSLAHAARGEA